MNVGTSLSDILVVRRVVRRPSQDVLVQEVLDLHAPLLVVMTLFLGCQQQTIAVAQQHARTHAKYDKHCHRHWNTNFGPANATQNERRGAALYGEWQHERHVRSVSFPQVLTHSLTHAVPGP